MQAVSLFDIPGCGVCQLFCSMDTNPPDRAHEGHFLLRNSRPSVWKYSSTVAPFVLASSVTPASRESSFSGIRPTDKIRVSQLYSSSVPGIGFMCSSTFETVTPVKRLSPWISVTVWLKYNWDIVNHLSTVQYFLEDRLDMAGSQKTAFTWAPSKVSLRAMIIQYHRNLRSPLLFPADILPY